MPYADLSFGEHLGALSPACFRGGWLGHTSALPLAGRTLMPKVGKSLGWTRLQIPKAEPRVAAGAHVVQIPQRMGRHSLKERGTSAWWLCCSRCALATTAPEERLRHPEALKLLLSVAGPASWDRGSVTKDESRKLSELVGDWIIVTRSSVYFYSTCLLAL